MERSRVPGDGAEDNREPPEGGADSGTIVRPMTIWFLLPLIILGAVALLLGTFALLGRVKNGKYLRPVVTTLMKVPLFRRGINKMTIAQLERSNPELASATKKLQTFGTPKTPEQAQKALALLSPTERKAYLEALGDQVDTPEPTNRAQRRMLEKGVQPGVVPTPRPVARKKRR
jgi:hypothetical protein